MKAEPAGTSSEEVERVATPLRSHRIPKLATCFSLMALLIALGTAGFVIYVYYDHVASSNAAIETISRRSDQTSELLEQTYDLLKKINFVINNSTGKATKRRRKRGASSDSDSDGIIDDEQAEEDLSDLSLTALSFMRGPPGYAGRDGRDGPPGPRGEEGATGHPGLPGVSGDSGERGPPGQNGLNGRDGMTGPRGDKGDSGAIGAPGVRGVMGLPGRSGEPGVRGPPGNPGPSGSPGGAGTGSSSGNSVDPRISDLISKVNVLEGAVTRLQTTSTSAGTAVKNGGGVYTRWGRNSCTNSSVTLYSGVAGGAKFDTVGAGVNFQCLPPNPDFDTYNIAAGDVSWMRSVEYESQAYGLFDNVVDNKQVVCARCHTGTRSAVMMIPAKTSCPTDWVKEYSGFLMASAESEPHPSTYECVDRNPQYLGLTPADYGGRFWFVSVDCHTGGSVGTCNQYRNGRQLTCVVCSK